MMQFEVVRPVTIDRVYQPGETVTVEGARPRLLRSLVDRRYLVPIDEPAPPATVAPEPVAVAPVAEPVAAEVTPESVATDVVPEPAALTDTDTPAPATPPQRARRGANNGRK